MVSPRRRAYHGPVRETIDPDTLDTLVGHHRRFLDFLERRVGSRAVAEELLQAAFVKGLERGGTSVTGRARSPGSTAS